jgi:hypothetical protein
MKQIKTFAWRGAAAYSLFLFAFRCVAGSLEVNSNEVITLTAGIYHYDSVTIHPAGYLYLLGDVTLNVDGDLSIESSSHEYYDPETGHTNISTDTGVIDISRNESLGGGTNGLAGADGAWATTNGQITSAVPGGAGQSGSSGQINPSVEAFGRYLQGYELVVNCGHDIYIDGYVNAETILLGGPGGLGGAGGRGGSGLPGTAPTNADYSYLYNGARGGNGGAGGDGGNAGYSPGGSRVILNASNNFTMGTNATIFAYSDAHGGNGVTGGSAGFGGSGSGPGRLGDGGDGGNGGNGGRSGNGGDIFIQARTASLAGEIDEWGADGGLGGNGAAGGALMGTGSLPGKAGRGGNGGAGRNGGDGGRLFVHALNVITNHLNINQSGGAAGLGGSGGAKGGDSGGADGGVPGLPGGDGFDGFNGYTSILSANAGLLNGDFTNGLALYRQAGLGTAAIVTLNSNAVLQMSVDTSTGPLVLSQLTGTAGNQQILLALDYKFLTPGGTLNLLLNDTILVSISSGGATSAFGTPEIAPNGEFTHASLKLSDPSLMGLSAANFTLQLLPGSPAQVEVDNLLFSSLPGPSLSIVRSNNDVIVKWPDSSIEYVLQENSNLDAANWTSVMPLPTDDGTNQNVTISPVTGNRFYRLRSP